MKPSQIQSLHTSLEVKIKNVLKFTKLAIGQPQQEAGQWPRAAVGTTVAFELLYAETYQEQTAQRDMGGRCSVFPLHPNHADDALGTRYWVGWFEEWKVKNARKELNLCTAAWSVFVGLRNQDMRQVIRAEWDQLPIRGRALSGQPHWHVDRFPQIGATLYGDCAAAVSAQTGLVLASETDGAAELGDLHLAMGAWDGEQAHPKCWQRWVGTPGDLVTWAVKTLQYLQSELSGRP